MSFGTTNFDCRKNHRIKKSNINRWFNFTSRSSSLLKYFLVSSVGRFLKISALNWSTLSQRAIPSFRNLQTWAVALRLPLWRETKSTAMTRRARLWAAAWGKAYQVYNYFEPLNPERPSPHWPSIWKCRPRLLRSRSLVQVSKKI